MKYKWWENASLLAGRIRKISLKKHKYSLSRELFRGIGDISLTALFAVASPTAIASLRRAAGVQKAAPRAVSALAL